jgi:hypothetical protein
MREDDRVRELFVWVEAEAARGYSVAYIFDELAEYAKTRLGLRLSGPVRHDVAERTVDFSFVGTKLAIRCDPNGWHLRTID